MPQQGASAYDACKEDSKSEDDNSVLARVLI